VNQHKNIQVFITDEGEFTLDYLAIKILKKVTLKKLFERNAE
jgi:hypothetical protein